MDLDHPMIKEAMSRGTAVGTGRQHELFEKWRDSMTNEDLKDVLLEVAETNLEVIDELLFRYWKGVQDD